MTQEPEAEKILPFEEFRSHIDEDGTLKQPYNNFYLYFLTPKLLGSMFTNIYRRRQWFEKFNQDHLIQVEEFTQRFSHEVSENPRTPRKHIAMKFDEELYELYKLARKYAPHEEITQ